MDKRSDQVKGSRAGNDVPGRDYQSIGAPERLVLAALGQQVGVSIENAELYDQLQSMAVLKERERLSRELHDGLVQVIGYLSIRTRVAADSVAAADLSGATVQLQEMQRTMEEVYQDIRESILGLRTTVTPSRGLVPALKEYVHKFGLQTGISVTLSADLDDHFEWSPEAEVQLLRIIQEALSNVRKHSLAKQAWIRLAHANANVTVTIEDNGRGFDIETVAHDGRAHFGLQTMKERAEAANGSLEIRSSPGVGTQIQVTWKKC
jgi:signal transduction histidine kinase